MLRKCSRRSRLIGLGFRMAEGCVGRGGVIGMLGLGLVSYLGFYYHVVVRYFLEIR